jgi:hypothetical protein
LVTENKIISLIESYGTLSYSFDDSIHSYSCNGLFSSSSKKIDALSLLASQLKQSKFFLDLPSFDNINYNNDGTPLNK